MNSTLSQELTVARRAMASEFSVTIPAEACRQPVETAAAALDEVERLEDLLSVFREESELACLNRSGGGPVSRELMSILLCAARLSRSTRGAFDPATGALVRAWAARRVPLPVDLAAARARSGLHHVHFDVPHRRITFACPGVAFNLGAFGKGYALDEAARRAGVRSALLQGGQSSILAVGTPPEEPRGWPVQLMDPQRPTRPLARLWLRNRALATSATTHQYFVQDGRRYGHILDPRTGWPVQHVDSVSVLAPYAGEADALSTALFVMGPAAGARFIEANPALGAIFAGPGGIRRCGAVDMEVTA